MNTKKYRIVKITEIANVERAIKGKVYEEGSVLIALSATKGQVEYLPVSGEVDPRWAVVTPSIDYDRYYIFVSIQEAFPEFIRKWKTGINLQFENLKHLEIKVHDVETQVMIANLFKIIEKQIEKVELTKRTAEDMKKSYLDKMLI